MLGLYKIYINFNSIFIQLPIERISHQLSMYYYSQSRPEFCLTQNFNTWLTFTDVTTHLDLQPDSTKSATLDPLKIHSPLPY